MAMATHPSWWSVPHSAMSSLQAFLAVLIVLIALAVLEVADGSSNQQVNILVPAYFDPTANAQAWSSLNSAASALPNGRVVAIANPNSGPGAVRQASYASAISALQAKSGKVIGYVATNYSALPASTVKANVDKYFNFYPTIDGIFFDEVANTNGKQAYYQDLYKYVKIKNTSSLVVNNPGTSTLESYLVYNGTRVTDIICVYESDQNPLTWTTASWATKYDRINFYAIPYNVPDVNVSSFDYGDVIDHAYQQNIGWVYVTDGKGSNPYGSLASYFPGEVYYNAQYNYL